MVDDRRARGGAGMVGDTLGGLEGDTQTAQKLVDMLKNAAGGLVQTREAHHCLRVGKMNVKAILPQLDKP